MVSQLFLLALLAQAPSQAATAMERGARAVDNSHTREAREKVLEAIQQTPASAELWIRLAEIDASLNSLDTAIADLHKALALGPSSAAAHFGLGLLWWRKGDTGKAREMYRKGLALKPADPQGNRNYSVLLMEAGFYREALVPLKTLASLDPRDLPVRVALIEAYLKSGMREEGNSETLSFMNLPSLSTQDKLSIARTLFEDKEASTAEFVLANLLAKSPESAEAYGEAGLLRLDQNQFEEAVRELGRATQMDPSSARYSLGLGRALLRWKNYPTALEFLRAIKERFGQFPDYQYELAWAYYGIRRYPESLALLETLADQHSNLDLVYYSMGNCHYMQGRLREAEERYRQAIRLNPRKASYYISLATVLRKQQRIEAALRFLRTALSLSPRNADAELEMALCAEMMGEYAKAQAALVAVILKKPDMVAAHRVLARVYYKQGKRAEGDKEAAIISQLDLADSKKSEAQLSLEAPFEIVPNDGSTQ